MWEFLGGGRESAGCLEKKEGVFFKTSLYTYMTPPGTWKATRTASFSLPNIAYFYN